MMKKRFLFNAAVLTGTSLVARTIGIAFRVYMSNMIGAQGIGLYQLICAVYFFATTFATSGITLIVTRLVTDSIAGGEPGKAKYVTRQCLFISLILSVAAAGLLFIFSDAIGTHFLNDARTVLSLRVLAPGLPFMAVSACFRGYFFARRTAIKTASEQLLEQVIEIAVFACVVGVMAPMGLSYACCAVAIGTTAAEILSCGYSYVLYRLDIKRLQGKRTRVAHFFRKALWIGIPVTLSSCLRSGLSTAENMLIPAGLKKNGASYEKSLSDYGLITGMAMPVILFPSVFLMSFSMLMIPEMSEAAAATRKNSIHYMTQRILRFALLFSIPVSVIFFFFADSLGALLYNDTQVGAYICMLAPLAPLLYLDSVVDGMLKGLNEQTRYLTYNIIDSVSRVVFIFILLPIWGIRGLIAVMFFSAVLNCLLSLMRLIKVTHIQFRLFDWVIKPFVACFLPCLALDSLCDTGLIPANGVWTVVLILLAVVFYLLIMTVTGAIKKEEIHWVRTLIKK